MKEMIRNTPRTRAGGISSLAHVHIHVCGFCVCVRACVRMCVCMCVCVCVYIIYKAESTTARDAAASV